MALDLATFDATKLTLLEVLDMAERAGVEPQDLASLLDRPSLDPTKARMLYALGWVIARRERPDLTWEEVQTWRMDVKGKADPAVSERNRIRALAVVNAAKLSNLSPGEAGDLTLAELEAYRKGRPNRAARRGRRH
jgi:hypothetical protein